MIITTVNDRQLFICSSETKENDTYVPTSPPRQGNNEQLVVMYIYTS